MVDTPCGNECKPLGDLIKSTDGIIARLSDGDKNFNSIKEELSSIKEDMKGLVDTLKQVKEIAEAMKNILDTWNTIQGFGRVVGWVSSAAKVIIPIGIALAALASLIQWVKDVLGVSSN